jgi:hypothetical protein
MIGILAADLGAVAETFVAGVFAVRKGLGKPIGSLTQMGAIKFGKRTDKRIPLCSLKKTGIGTRSIEILSGPCPGR